MPREGERWRDPCWWCGSTDGREAVLLRGPGRQKKRAVLCVHCRTHWDRTWRMGWKLAGPRTNG